MLRTNLVWLVVVLGFIACSPEPGSKSWCDSMDEKPAGDWTANEAAEYAKSCVFKNDE
jgi:hypothetical protein